MFVILRLRNTRLRWLAHLSRDLLLVQAFTSGREPAEVVAGEMGIDDTTGRAAIAAWLEADAVGFQPTYIAVL